MYKSGLINYFCAGSTARSAAELSGVNRKTAVLFFHKLRETIQDIIVSYKQSMMGGEIEVDESYLAAGAMENADLGPEARFR